jgi:hypothetical protein
MDTLSKIIVNPVYASGKISIKHILKLCKQTKSEYNWQIDNLVALYRKMNDNFALIFKIYKKLLHGYRCILLKMFIYQ